MKKLIFTGFFLALFIALTAQVTLDKRYEYSTTVVKLETLGYKYYLMDVPGAQCRIYNMDHSLLKTINCNVPNGYYLADIKFMSENLFDNDADIDILYTYYKYVATSSSYYYIYGSRIINENGSIIMTIEGSQYNYINKTGDDTYKLFSYCFDYSVSPEKVWTNIYNLPGSPYSSVAIENVQTDLNLKSYPNPASETVKVEYTLPENTQTATLFLVNSKGQTVSTFLIDNHINHLDLDVSSLTAGMYYYFVEYGGQRSETGKVSIW